MPNQWPTILAELERMRSLRDDWDGEGTLAPEPALVDRAIVFANHNMSYGDAPPDRVHASVNGTIYFEWHFPSGYQEVEFESPIAMASRFVPK